VSTLTDRQKFADDLLRWIKGYLSQEAKRYAPFDASARESYTLGAIEERLRQERDSRT
jgi:hypothetical protein